MLEGREDVRLVIYGRTLPASLVPAGHLHDIKVNIWNWVCVIFNFTTTYIVDIFSYSISKEHCVSSSIYMAEFTHVESAVEEMKWRDRANTICPAACLYFDFSFRHLKF